MRSAGVPSKTIRPPSWPAPGPRSMIQSACAMTAWWCSMTMTDLPEPDLCERVEGVLQRAEQRRHRWLVEAADPPGQVADLHRAGVGDVDALDLRRPGLRGEPGAAAVRTGGEGDRAPHERADVRLQRVDVLGQERL